MSLRQSLSYKYEIKDKISIDSITDKLFPDLIQAMRYSWVKPVNDISNLPLNIDQSYKLNNTYVWLLSEGMAI